MQPTRPEEHFEDPSESITLVKARPRTEPERTVVGVFADADAAAEAVHRLVQGGFDARREVVRITDEPEAPEVPLAHRAEARAGLVSAVGWGATIGAFVGLLMGNGLLPPLEGLIGGGPVRAMASGALLGALVGAVPGGLRWWLVARTSGERRDGPREARVGVRATSEERAGSAMLVLREAGALDVREVDADQDTVPTPRFDDQGAERS